MPARDPEPWAEGDHLPWDEPGFSKRILKEHLSQKHDGASRRFTTIDRHVEWIHSSPLDGERSRILDLGCGPGLYLQRLAKLGHDCIGIDFSPASIAYANYAAKEDGLSIRYLCQDIREAEFGTELDLVMLLWGEFNAFAPEEARELLLKSFAALGPYGRLILEPASFGSILRRGQKPRWESVCDSGLFLDSPHVCVGESYWNPDQCAATNRWTITNHATEETIVHSASYQGYTDKGYHDLLRNCGFSSIEKYASLTGTEEGRPEELPVFVGWK